MIIEVIRPIETYKVHGTQDISHGEYIGSATNHMSFDENYPCIGISSGREAISTRNV